MLQYHIIILLISDEKGFFKPIGRTEEREIFLTVKGAQRAKIYI